MIETMMAREGRKRTVRSRPRKSRPADRRPRRKAASSRGRRSAARLGRTYETVVAQPRQVRAGRGVLARLGLRPQQAVGLALLLLLTALVSYLFASDDFYVWDAQIVGLEWLERGEVYRAAGVEGFSIFYVDPLEVQEAVAALPGVREARVVCRLPNQVRIQVAERTPAAIWQSGGVQYWVDEAGVLFPRAGDLENPLVIVEQDAAERRPGEPVDQSVLDTALALHELLPEVCIFGYARSEGLWFNTGSGRQVLVRVGDDARRVAAALKTVEQELRAGGSQARVIDLRYDTRAYWR